VQSKAIAQRLKRLEKQTLTIKPLYVFFGEPSNVERAKLPIGAKVLIFTGEDELED